MLLVCWFWFLIHVVWLVMVLASPLEHVGGGASTRPALEFAHSTGLAGLSRHLSGGVGSHRGEPDAVQGCVPDGLVYLLISAISTHP
jgi:hypothetical protein